MSLQRKLKSNVVLLADFSSSGYGHVTPSHFCRELTCLWVAMTAGQLEAFKLLRTLEVGIDEIPKRTGWVKVAPYTTIARFAQKLSRRDRLEYLVAFVDGVRSAPGEERFKRDRDRAIVSFIPFIELITWAPMELLRTLMRHRAPHDGVLWAQHV